MSGESHAIDGYHWIPFPPSFINIFLTSYELWSTTGGTNFSYTYPPFEPSYINSYQGTSMSYAFTHSYQPMSRSDVDQLGCQNIFKTLIIVLHHLALQPQWHQCLNLPFLHHLCHNNNHLHRVECMLSIVLSSPQSQEKKQGER